TARKSIMTMLFLRDSLACPGGLPPIFPNTPGRHGRLLAAKLLPAAFLPQPAPVRGPPRRLRRWLLPEGRRQAVRLLLRRRPPLLSVRKLHRAPPRRPPPPLSHHPHRAPPPRQPQGPPRPDKPPVADARCLSLAPGRCLRSRLAGVFLFLPLLARLPFDQVVGTAGYPGSKMIPASSALLSLLTLKLLDKERRSHVNDFSFDEALGLFCGLNVLPSQAFLTEYSYRTTRDHQRALLSGWVSALSGLLFPRANTFSLDFHPIPYRGDDAGLETHYVPLAGKAQPSVLSFFALEQESRVL